MLSGESTVVNVTEECSVGWLRMTAALWLERKGWEVTQKFDCIYGTRVLRNDYIKLYEIADCTEGDPPAFTIVPKEG
jgi:hypothetical protein